MSLAASQSAFMAQVLDEDAPLPAQWTDRRSAGLAVYRNNYRSSLVEVLRSTYERTARWAGEDAFERAAVHHVITHPPSSWTLDEAGRGFDATCAQLFANDPEVAELAWLEWSMFEVFTAPDMEPLDAARLGEATAAFSDEDWGSMRLGFMPGIAQREVDHDLLALWNTLGSEEFERIDARLELPKTCTVWREGERPVFSLGATDEGAALKVMLNGASYGEACDILASEATTEEQLQEVAMRAGAMLGRWLNDGLIAAVNRSECCSGT